MRKFFNLSVSLAALVLLAPLLFADDSNDPAFFENLTGCTGANWCASVGAMLDPLAGGLTTEAYQFNTSFIPSVVAGDVKVTEAGGAVGDVIRFETIAGTPYAFIYSSDVSTGLAADVGLPASFQTNTVTIAETATGLTNLYTPTRDQPGFTALTAGQYANTTYALMSADTPEPVPTYLVGTALAMLIGAVMRRRRLP